jgi:iron complex transport system substrate-binding protein
MQSMKTAKSLRNHPRRTSFRASCAVVLGLLVATALSAQTQPALLRSSVLGGKAVVMVADLVYAFPEARPTVLGVAGTDQGLGSFLQTVDPGFSAKPVLDRSAGAEVYATLKPDLVILKSSMKKSLGSQLEALGLHSLYLNLETPEDYYRDIAALGTAFGATKRAEELSAYYRGIIARTQSKTGVGSQKAPRVLVVQASLLSGEAFDVPPKTWMQSILVGLAGGEPAWFGANPGEGWGRIGFEQIAAWNPDVLLVIDYREGVDATVAALRKDPRFAALACSRNGRILGFPQDWYSWDQPDTRWSLGLLWMAKVLRPSEFAELDLVSEARSFYRLFYGFDPATFDRMVAPRLKGDYAPAK